jgi:hypothetical protein
MIQNLTILFGTGGNVHDPFEEIPCSKIVESL